jgi:transcription elongation GreA/GreB family factor
MVSESPVMLTANGMLQLHTDLKTFRERHSALARANAASPDDWDGGMLTDLALTQRRIAEIQDLLARATPIDGTAREPGVVGIGATVTVRWDGDGEETYTIVDPAEIDLDAGRISHESPVGEALVGRRAGDRVAVTTLAGPAWLAVVSVD